MAPSDDLLPRDEVLCLLFGALQPLLEFDVVTAVECRNGEDRSVVFSARPLEPQLAQKLADEVLEGLRRFSGESHHKCLKLPFETVMLGKESASNAWAGPAQSVVDAPLIVGGRVVGLVRVAAAAPNAFSAEKSAIIYASAQQASAFLERLDEKALADRRLSESLVNGLRDGVIIVDAELRTLLSNATAATLLADLMGRPGAVAAAIPGTPLESLAREVLSHPESPQHQDFSLSDETQRRISVTATAPGTEEEGAILVLRDVTEEHLMQERLLQSEKMASVGQLVSGVAHELNNPLTGVTGFAQLLLNRDLDDQTRHDVETIYSEAERAAKIVQNLLSFARRRKAQKGLVNLNTLLERVLELRSYDLTVKNVDLELDLDPRLPLTMSDPDQIQQVLFNIITNAEHAMLSAHGGGKLKVRSRADKGYILLSFMDDGVGIPPEDLRRVFDPFFTTKEGGQGTGLGLTISYGIIDDHGGRIRVESRPGKGATFVIELPIVQGPDLPLSEAEEEIEPAHISRRVLVVDDEESILALLRDVLTGDGHHVDTARNGEEALKHLALHGYDLLITDIKMPGMGGQALYQRVKQMDSELARNTVFITGDTVSAETRSFLQRVQNTCLAKPFKIREVREALNRLLGES